MKKVLIFLFCVCLVPLWGNRSSSAPYLSGDTFRTFCNFTYDELNRSLDPLAVKNGNTIFVKTDFIEEFFANIHPRIQAKYILVTHNGDAPVPRGCASFLEDEKLIAWFGQNVENYTHPKLHPIPIGIANQCWPHGNISIVTRMRNQLSGLSKKNLLYMNFTIGSHPERSQVADLLRNQSYCVFSTTKD